MVAATMGTEGAPSAASAEAADHPFLWAVPLIYDTLRASYYAWLPGDDDTAERLTKLHGAIVIMALIDVPEDEWAPAMTQFLTLCCRTPIDAARLERLGYAVMEELRTVIALRHRRSPRLQLQLDGEVMGRLAAPREVFAAALAA